MSLAEAEIDPRGRAYLSRMQVLCALRCPVSSQEHPRIRTIKRETGDSLLLGRESQESGRQLWALSRRE